MKQDIKKLDPNFNQVETDDSLRWFDARELTVEGIGWPNESQPFCRLPDCAQANVCDPVWELSRHSAGVCVRFSTNASTIASRWELRFENLALPHMAGTGVSGLDLYARDGNRWRWAAAGQPDSTENEATLLKDCDGGTRDFMLHLPLYNGVQSVEIGIPQGAMISPCPRIVSRKPICFYGTSIVQGGCASRPGMNYPALISRRLDWPVINLGFSGNGKSEPEIADLLAQLDVAAWVIDPVPSLSPPQIRERIEAMIDKLRVAQPDAAIVLVEKFAVQNDWLFEASRHDIAQSREALWSTHQAALRRGIKNLYYVAGDQLLGDDGEGTVDRVHPTDVGFMRMADVIAPLLHDALHSSNE